MATPVLLDTDIGTDIDDAYALVLAAVSPEIDLRGVVTVNHDTGLRAGIARVLLDQLGRTDVPVVPGAGPSLTPGVERGWIGHEGYGIDLSCIDPEVDFLGDDVVKVYAREIDKAYAAGTPLQIVSIGPSTNVAAVLRELPVATVCRIGGIVAMASTFAGYGFEYARAEHNVACDPVAFAELLSSPVSVSLVGLNVTLQTAMTAEHVGHLAAIGSPLSASLVGMHRVWFEFLKGDRSAMHDALAVAAVFQPDLMGWIPVHAICVDKEDQPGAVQYDPCDAAAAHCRIAGSVDAGAYHELLFGRVMAAARGAAPTE